MNFDSIAQRFPDNEGRALVDYIPVFLPCQILLVDALVIERHRISTPVEFVMKAIAAGIVNSEMVGDFLGLSKGYTTILIEQMKDDELIIGDGSGELVILPRGKEIMQGGGDRRIIDKGISILWDPISEQPIFSRPSLVSDHNKDTFPKRVRFPAILKTPKVDAFDISTVQSYRRYVNDIAIEDDREDLLRLVSVRRSIHRYREAIVLLYDSGRLPIAKIAIDNLVDEGLSSAFAQKDGTNFLGIDSAFSRKAGAIAVDERLKRLAVKTAGADMRAVAQQRGILRLKIDAWKSRLEEEPSKQVNDQLQSGIAQLHEIERLLDGVAVRALNAAEMNLCLVDALTNSSRSIVMTTTIPNEFRFTRSVVTLMESALLRGVRISIYISDRPHDESTKSGRRSKSPLSRLNTLSQSNASFQVAFLQQIQRPVFEILWDDSELAFSNDPPLGLRSDASIPRLFKGFKIADCAIVKNYVSRNMNFTDDDIVKNIKLPKVREKTSGKR